MAPLLYWEKEQKINKTLNQFHPFPNSGSLCQSLDCNRTSVGSSLQAQTLWLRHSVSMCVCERDRARDDSVWVCECVCVCERERVAAVGQLLQRAFLPAKGICWLKPEEVRERTCVRVCMCVRARVWELFQGSGERECVWERERGFEKETRIFSLCCAYFPIFAFFLERLSFWGSMFSGFVDIQLEHSSKG